MTTELLEQEPQSQNRRVHVLLTILVVDIVRSTGLLRELGDDRYADVIETFKESTEAVMAGQGGSQHADTGDGYIYTFSTASAAVVAAIEMFRDNLALRRTRDHPINLRCGIHNGELVLSRFGIVGMALYQACELGNAADSGELWLSKATFGELRVPCGTHRLASLPRSGPTSVVSFDADEMRRLSALQVRR